MAYAQRMSRSWLVPGWPSGLAWNPTAALSAERPCRFTCGPGQRQTGGIGSQPGLPPPGSDCSSPGASGPRVGWGPGSCAQPLLRSPAGMARALTHSLRVEPSLLLLVDSPDSSRPGLCPLREQPTGRGWEAPVVVGAVGCVDTARGHTSRAEGVCETRRNQENDISLK